MRRRVCVFALVVAFLIPRPAGATPNPIASGPTGVPVVALTFDDGPHERETPILLDILEKHGVRATFFIVGTRAVDHPDILNEIVAMGHGVANHSWSHRNMPLLERQAMYQEIAFCSQAIEAITGIRPKFFRPPGGNWDSALLEVASDLGLPLVLWSLNAYDTRTKSAEEIAALVIRRAGPGSIILMHGGMENTMLAIPAIIEGLRAKGLLFATLDQMFRFAPTAMSP
ncbi:MAG TPA: polysaccharide deacetylase family protein, partial [Synergistetes bacterium]|nr:polysaccharide deacetylase family protein [Synergistota bacterium]